MKLKIALLCCVLLFISCLPDEERGRIGVMFEIINLSNLEHKNVKITIGGIEDGNFVGTESYILPTIRIRNNNTDIQYVAVDYNRWKPNLNLVKKISDKAYFTVQLEDKPPVLLYEEYDSTKLVCAEFVNNGIMKIDYGGYLSIVFHENSVKGLFFER